MAFPHVSSSLLVLLVLVLLLLLLLLPPDSASGQLRRAMPDKCYEHPSLFVGDDYDLSVAPPRSGAAAAAGDDAHPVVVVTVRSHILDLVEVDDQLRRITLTLVSLKSWKDPRLQVRRNLVLHRKREQMQ